MSKGLGGIAPGFNYLNSDEARKAAAWAKAAPYPRDATDWRRIDCDGRVIYWAEYGKYTEYGWHIDHAVPSSIGGMDQLQNLRARHWQGNCAAGGILGGLLNR